jgi:maltose alpha-D-glucosyltransferase / alpha-amylase
MAPGPDPSPSRAEIDHALAGLDLVAVADARWFGQKGRSIEAIELDEAFLLDGAGPHVLAVAQVRLADGEVARYSFALTGRPLRLAEPDDGAWRAVAAAMAAGRTVAAIPGADGETPTAALVCRPATAMPSDVATASERDLGVDQSNTSVVLGEQVLLKAYRRLQPGLNPELELLAFLTEEAAFPAVPALAGFAEMVSARDGTATVAIAQAFVNEGADLYESLAEALTSWLLAPGEVTVEFATEVAADLGSLTAGLHAALAGARGVPGFEPREATRDELSSWTAEGLAQFDRAVAVVPADIAEVLRNLAPAITAELRVFATLLDPIMLTRVHGDYHVGQILLAPDGYRIVDFEGEPTRSLEERRAHQSPLRDVAKMLRSIDHVGRDARRRAVARNGGPIASPGLDFDGWLRRSRERFLESYRAGLREAGARITVDPALVRAFEIDTECYEFIYAATWLPSWLWAPTEAMLGLVENPA